MPRPPKTTRKQRLLNALNPNTGKKRFLIFIAIFAVFGGGYMLYQSFAGSYDPPKLSGNDGNFASITPARVLDTRTTTGGINHSVAAGRTEKVQIAGQGGVPATGVKAVVMNVTITGASSESFVSVWPDGESRPNVSNLNFPAGKTTSNQVTVKVGANGKVQLFNAAGNVHVIFDVAGYYTDAAGVAAGRYESLTPARILDTRNGTGGINTPVGQGQTVPVQITGRGGVPNCAKTVVMNVTVVGATAPSYVTIFPSDGARPNSSNLNFQAGEIIPNQVTVKLGTDGKVKLYNHLGSVNVIFDVAGYFDETDSPATQNGRFVPLTPFRLEDTRISGRGGPLAQGQTRAVKVVGAYDVPVARVKAVVMNVTVTNPTAESFLTIWPNGQSRPVTSNLNFSRSQTIPNQVTAEVGDEGKILMYNAGGSTDVIFDVAGYYIDDETYMSASGTAALSVYEGNAKKLQLDYTPLELPTKDVGQLRTSFGARYSSLMYTDVNYKAGNVPEIKSSCINMPVQKCKLLVPGITETSPNGNYANFTIQYDFKRGSTYTYIEEVKTDQPGYPGSWAIISIGPAGGTISPILTKYVGENQYDNSIPKGVTSNGFYQNYSCKKPEPFSWSISNVYLDSQPVDLAKGIDNYSTVFQHISDCKGVSSIDYAPGPSNKTVMTYKMGKPASTRDTTNPTIGNIAVSGSGIAVNSSDNTAVASLKLFLEDANESYELQQVFGNGYGKDWNGAFVYSGIPAGTYQARGVATDNSGNTVEKIQTVTIP